MKSMIGAKRMLKYKRFEASKRPSKASGAYLDRNLMLPTIGYASYKEYLKSDDWKAIRAERLRRHKSCLICLKTATEVHHRDYHVKTLMGFSESSLVTLCRSCHETVEFDGARKRTLAEANIQLNRMAADAKREGWFRFTESGDRELHRSKQVRHFTKKRKKRKKP